MNNSRHNPPRIAPLALAVALVAACGGGGGGDGTSKPAATGTR